MKSRMMKFLIMLLTVIAVGSATTMLNLALRGDGEPKASPYLSRNDHDPVQQLMDADARVPERIPYDMTDRLEQNVMTETVGEILLEQVEDSDITVPASESNVQEEALGNSKNSMTQREKQSYYWRLQDMEKVHSAQNDTAMKGSLTEQQNVVEMMLKAWDDELNAIYQKLRHSLAENEFYQLREEERAWIRQRDEAANLAAARESYSNSTQKLAYTRSLLIWTRDRVYELAAMYYGN